MSSEPKAGTGSSSKGSSSSAASSSASSSLAAKHTQLNNAQKKHDLWASQIEPAKKEYDTYVKMWEDFERDDDAHYVSKEFVHDRVLKGHAKGVGIMKQHNKWCHKVRELKREIGDLEREGGKS